ncbi:MAG: DUF4296 domain-containing protein [Bacteroidetes bacterium]|nr:DUF4296 domain-containing protein [Bacteroidota bacterium]
MLVIDQRMNMKKAGFLFILILLLSSCYNTHDGNKIPKPDNLIGKDKLVLVIADMEIAESTIREKQNLGQEIDGLQERFYLAIFQKHEITKEQFENSMAYYKQDLDELNDIYEEVITRLSMMESEVQHE